MGGPKKPSYPICFRPSIGGPMPKKANHFGARNPSRWFFPTPNKWKTLTKALVVCCIKGIILPSYVGITLSKYKDDAHKPIITMFLTLLKCCEMSFSLEIFGFWRFFGGFWSFLTFRDLIFCFEILTWRGISLGENPMLHGKHESHQPYEGFPTLLGKFLSFAFPTYPPKKTRPYQRLIIHWFPFIRSN